MEDKSKLLTKILIFSGIAIVLLAIILSIVLSQGSEDESSVLKNSFRDRIFAEYAIC